MDSREAKELANSARSALAREPVIGPSGRPRRLDSDPVPLADLLLALELGGIREA